MTRARSTMATLAESCTVRIRFTRGHELVVGGTWIVHGMQHIHAATVQEAHVQKSLALLYRCAHVHLLDLFWWHAAFEHAVHCTC